MTPCAANPTPAHLATCASCRELAKLVAVARQLGAPVPSVGHREEARTALLARAQLQSGAVTDRSRKRWAIAGLTLAVAAAAVVMLITATPTATPMSPSLARAPIVTVENPAHRHGAIRPRGHAQFSHPSATPDELVVLHDGTLDIEVAPLHATERFRVIIGAAEVEVHGTAFAVTARQGVLVEVTVSHGVVEVRADGTAQRLTAGQAWRAPNVRTATGAPPQSLATPPSAPTPTPTREPAVVQAVPLSSPPSPSPPPPPPPAPVAPPRAVEELAYDTAWQALRASDFTTAARAFAQARTTAPHGPLAEDAHYWEAVAWARAKLSIRAVEALTSFLALHPQSRRAGEAATMLGWLLVDDGQPAAAARWFRTATTDATPAVRASAEAGLAATTSAAP